MEGMEEKRNIHANLILRRLSFRGAAIKTCTHPTAPSAIISSTRPTCRRRPAHLAQLFTMKSPSQGATLFLQQLAIMPTVLADVVRPVGFSRCTARETRLAPKLRCSTSKTPAALHQLSITWARGEEPSRGHALQQRPLCEPVHVLEPWLETSVD